MAEPMHDLPSQPVHDEFPQWHFAPVEPVGWTATETTGNGHIHVVAAPTIHELRLKLRQVASRKA